jgi:hypothetical protein
MRKHFTRACGAACVAALPSLFVPLQADAATASLNGSSSWTLTHNPGGPGGSATTTPGLTDQATSTPSITYSNTKTFKVGGTTKGKAGVGRSVSSTVAKTIFPSGIGVDQTDPAPASQSASVVRIDFNSIFDITGAGTFGPTINGVFSIPLGVTIAPGGVAQFGCHIEWDKKVSGVTSQARPDYDINDGITYTTGGNGTGGLFTNPSGSSISVLKSFTVDSAPFSPSSITGGVGDQLICHGWIQFAANNDNGPVSTVTPRDPNDQDPDPGNPDPDPFSIFDSSTPEDLQILSMVPQAGFEVPDLPEPTSALLFAAAPLILRRHRKQA